jgi:hypothetical protein
MRITKLIGLLIVLFIGCATTMKHNTPSGKPETVINDKVAEQVTAIIMEVMANRQYYAKTLSRNLLVFEKSLNNFKSHKSFGGKYDLTPAARIIYTILETDSTTRIIASLLVVTNPNSEHEKLTAMNESRDSVYMQEFLNKLKLGLEEQ